MAQSMRLFLIRHGETVDNVAQLYAGSRDSALTNHGYQQATRLGLHLQALGLKFTHLFSSHLQRAAKTADLIRKAQLPQIDKPEAARDVPQVQRLPILMEQDFGDLEGKKWTDIQVELQNKPGFVATETKEAMGRRADAFLDQYLLPLLDETSDRCSVTVAVVSHGIFLSTLWKRLLRRLPEKSVALSPELQSSARPSLEHLGGWSNTGYLELLWTRENSSIIPDATISSTSKPDTGQPTASGTTDIMGTVADPESPEQQSDREYEVPTSLVDDRATTATPSPTTARTSEPRFAYHSTTEILTINGKDHLKGLKRTGGGVGSSRHDASQRGIESFFKRRKVD